MILLDANVLIAIASEADQNHDRATRLIETIDDTLLVPPTVVTEVCWLVVERDRDRRAEVGFLRSFSDPEDLRLTDLTAEDLSGASVLVERYEDLGGTDASIVAIAERLRITEIATFDHRHFGVVRPAHAEYFTLLP